MKILSALVLYTCMMLGANAALADMAAIKAMREGDMKKLIFHEEARDVSKTPFETGEGGTATLADYRGKVVVLNFWATWCAPCRKEMPTLSELQAEMGGDEFEVVTLATGRNPPPAMKTFFDEIGVDNLPLHRDPDMKIAREMGILGLPITVIMNREGQEIARLQGEAHWSSDTARAILQALVDRDASG